MKRLITLTSTVDKTPEQVHQELAEALVQYRKAKPTEEKEKKPQ
jgi:hypothetical protein